MKALLNTPVEVTIRYLEVEANIRWYESSGLNSEPDELEKSFIKKGLNE